MSKRIGLIQASIGVAMLAGAALVSTGARAQDCCQGGSATGANAWTSGNATSAQWPSDPATILGMTIGSAPVAPVPYWWYHGEIEVGGRGFTSAPPLGGSPVPGQTVWSQGGNLAKYYEYGIVAPGAFAGFHVATGSSDGLYQVDLWANNIGSYIPATGISNLHGFSDQSYLLQASKAGEQYIELGWDQTPHVYSTTALTPYLGVGSNALTLPPGLSAALFGICNPCAANLGTAVSAGGAGAPAAVAALLNGNLNKTDLGIQRDTASVKYRWTPDEAWDIHVDYSNTHRTGTQVEGVNFSPGTSGVVAQVPRPVDDTTQNYAVNGEYAGTSLWGQKFTFKAGYVGSTYKDTSDFFTVQNPFCPAGGGIGTAAPCAGPVSTSASGGFYSTSQSNPLALVSLWPDNQANDVNATLGADLPWNSRYVGTVSYNMMRQNEAFLPYTLNPFIWTANGQTTAPGPGNFASTAFGPPLALPASSLNGAIDTLMVNNVVTTQITPDLKSKLSYRYYNFDNGTPEINFANYVLEDAKLASVAGFGATPLSPVNSLSISYIKQNAGADLDWHPDRYWNLGAAYGWEHYNWSMVAVDGTNENSGKVWADWKPWTWLTARASWLTATRRYESYNDCGFYSCFQWPDTAGAQASIYMRQFYFDNRDRNKGQIQVSIDLIKGLTMTPSFSFTDDVYKLDPGAVGLTRNLSYASGVEFDYVFDPTTTFLLAYMNEQRAQDLLTTNATAGTALTPTTTYFANDTENINTITAGAKFALIPDKPDKLNVRLDYTYAFGTDNQPLVYVNGTTNAIQYPENRSLWERFDAVAKYKFDDDVVHQFGFKGDLFATLRYTWERSSISYWEQDIMATSMFSNSASYGYMLWMAYDNPNYNVQMLTASLTASW